MAGAGAQKDIEVLVRAVRHNGFNVVPAKGGHRKVMLRGKAVIDNDGPVIFSGTTGDHRGRTMAVKRLMKAGVLKEDPFASHTETKATRDREKQNGNLHKGNPHLSEPWMRERAQAAMKVKSEQNRLATIGLREKWEPHMVKLGGWEKKGLLTQIAEAAHWLLTTRGWVGMENVSSPQWCYHVLQKMRKGETLAEQSRERFDEFVRDLERHPDPIVRYFEIVRLSKGLSKDVPDAPPSGTAVGAAVAFPVRNGTGLPLPGQDEEHPEAPAERAVAARRAPVEHPTYTVPTLALEAVWRMGKARDADYDDVMGVGERILKLELESRGG